MATYRPIDSSFMRTQPIGKQCFTPFLSRRVSPEACCVTMSFAVKINSCINFVQIPLQLGMINSVSPVLIEQKR